jgi:hypothetical protein
MPDNVVSLPQRGKTYLTGPNRTADSTGTVSKAIEGIVKVFKDLDYGTTYTPTKAPRSGGEVTCILVRNASGMALLPKMAVTWKSGLRGKQVDGYADFSPDRAIAGIVDEWLPTTGCPNNDYFWLTVRGPTLALTALPGDETNVISVDDWLVNSTGAASTHSTTSGRVIPLIPPTAGLTTNITFAQSSNLYKFARAMSAKTTGNTNADILVYVDLY